MPSDLNNVVVTGCIQGFKIYDDAKYPWAWVRLGIGKVPYLDSDGETCFVDAGNLFLNFSVPKQKRKNMNLLKNGRWLSTWEAFLYAYKKDKGKTQYKIKASAGKFMVNDSAMMPVNEVQIAGRVSDQSKDGNWYRVSMSYLDTFEKDERKRWKTRFCKIYSPYYSLKVGSRYLITGCVVGSDPSGKDGLAVIAKTVSKGRF